MLILSMSQIYRVLKTITSSTSDVEVVGMTLGKRVRKEGSATPLGTQDEGEGDEAESYK